MSKPFIVNLLLCLALGNSVGITSIVLTAKKLKWVQVPDDINNQYFIGVSFLSGICFTMPLLVF
ncbi:Na+/H+ antiporter NhaA [Gelidibacter salicanalis]|uniref:Na+/H+ antiporter NhaA n=1 Tax=Gelidibacter salicanalis TaxID=291193 RepID=A0A934NIC2_9FLAO|nr:Na+/H+ antiporter NhaA [Gelidibacter salicanalis]MBJ7880933.1 Na+/H+ antiporter NhaA [Gelidibacter salicanalis]